MRQEVRTEWTEELGVQRERGAVLLYTIMAAGLISLLVGVVTRMSSLSQKEEGLLLKRLSRNKLGRELAAALTNPSVLLASTKEDISLPANQLLRNCIGTLDPTLAQAVRDGAKLEGSACDTTGIDPEHGLEFLLVPSTTIFGVPQGRTLKAESNCPDPQLPWRERHISCFLAGELKGVEVGYNFYRDSGAASPEFPLVAKAFFLPVCSSKTAQLRCPFAELIKLRYEIEHRVFPGQKYITKLGRYPFQRRWLSVETIDVAGLSCNEGAIAFVSGAAGQLECRCQTPYRPLLRAGKPVFNARGPLCEAAKRACPTGFLRTGNDAAGNPICELLSDKAVVTARKQYVSTGPSWDVVSCNDNNGGWVSNVRRHCTSTIHFEEVSCPEGCGSDTQSIITGAAIGALAGLLAATIMMAIFPPGGLVLLIAALAVLGMGVGGAAVGYAMGLNWDWIYMDNTRGLLPDIKCTVDIDCSAPR